MNAHIISDNTINELTAYYKANVPYQRDSNIAQELIDENYRGVNARYMLSNEPHKTAYMNRISTRSPVEILKLVGTYEYESWGSCDWPTTLAYKYMQDIKNIAIRNLPGYEDAPQEL